MNWSLEEGCLHLKEPGNTFVQSYKMLIRSSYLDYSVCCYQSLCADYCYKYYSAVVGAMNVIAIQQNIITSKITIITSYNAPKAMYLKMIRGIQEKMCIPFNKLPRVATIDLMQGHDPDIVILGWVNGYGKQLGFLRENRRANVALTRARASLIVLFHQGFMSYYSEDKVDKPKVLTHWDYLVRKRLVIQV